MERPEVPSSVRCERPPAHFARNWLAEGKRLCRTCLASTGISDADGQVLYVAARLHQPAQARGELLLCGVTPGTRIAHMVTHRLDADHRGALPRPMALLLENNLIKAPAPRYNILFRDDKSYPQDHCACRPQGGTPPRARTGSPDAWRVCPAVAEARWTGGRGLNWPHPSRFGGCPI